MQSMRVVRLLVAASFATQAAFAAQCDESGRLCASGAPNTSAPPPREIRIALILPTRSESLAAPADALRAGFMAAWERDKAGTSVALIETGGEAQQAADAYQKIAPDYDVVVGPLARNAVAAVAASPPTGVPTVALNFPGTDIPLPQQMLVMGLSIEDEARQVANWAAAEHAGARAVVLAGPSAWQRRIASAFAAQWASLGRKSVQVQVFAGHELDEAELDSLQLQLSQPGAVVMFSALDAEQTRSLRSSVRTGIPLYGTSAANPGRTGEQAELEGLRLLDLPWQVQPDHPAVMVYPRLIGERPNPDLDRLYALGIDAFRVANKLARQPGSAFLIDGVTGKLAISVNGGMLRCERAETAVVYRAGAFSLVRLENP